MNGKNVFRQKFTRIEGLSSIRRLPRLGKIRLGIKKVSAKTGKEYPSETKYFVCPPEIKKVIGDEPTELNIMFPLNDPEALFPQAYKWYGSSKGLKCRGDGVNALRLNEDTGKMEERECPCELLENGKCKQRASLSFMMPGIKIGGVYQIDLSSYHSIVDINSGLDYAMGMLGGKIAMVPFILRRVPKETHNEGKKQIHYTLTLELNIGLDYAQRIREGENIFMMQKKRYEIEAPIEYGNPVYDNKKDGAIIEKETEKEAKTREAKEAKQEKAKQEALTKEYEETNKKQTELKKQIEAGKHNTRTPEEIKAKLEKRNKILDEVQTVARAYKVNTWGEIVDVGERHKVFPGGLVTSQVKTLIVDHLDKCEALKEAFKKDSEITDEDLGIKDQD